MEFLKDLSPVGLFTLVLLVVCSVLLIALVFERLYFIKQNVIDPEWLHSNIAFFLNGGKIDESLHFVRQVGGLLPRVYEVGLQRYHLPQEAGEAAMANSI